MRRRHVINYAPTMTKLALGTVHNSQRGKAHRHACSNTHCRLVYEDMCQTPEVNGRCQPCQGRRRPWVYADGLTALDPHMCCIANAELMTSSQELARYDCAGPGPWFQCNTCKRTHGHPCTDPDLIARAINVQEDKS